MAKAQQERFANTGLAGDGGRQRLGRDADVIGMDQVEAISTYPVLDFQSEDSCRRLADEYETTGHVDDRDHVRIVTYQGFEELRRDGCRAHRLRQAFLHVDHRAVA